MKKRWIFSGGLASLAALAIFVANSLTSPEGLAALEDNLTQTHSDIEHIQPTSFSAMQYSKTPPIILDVREEDEFAVSHISGAVRVSPDATADEVIELLLGKAEGADVAFYCSVGVRSSILASRAAERVKSMGAASVANLRGGIFRWHNEKRDLVAGNHPTDQVHPYDDRWGRLVERDDLIAYERTPAS